MKNNKFISYKFLLMITLMFCVLLNLNSVRILKDSLIISSLGAEIINFIKLWIEMPVGIIFVIVYNKLINIFDTERVFQIIVLSFTVIFATFIFFILPNKETLDVDTVLINSLISSYPNFKFFIMMFGNWTLVIFYVTASLWPVIIYSLLFWQVMNKINTGNEAINNYPIINFIGQLNLLLSGSILTFLSRKDNPFFIFVSSIFGNQNTIVNILSILVITTSFIIILVLFFIKKGDYNSNKQSLDVKKDHPNLSIKESLKFIFASKTLIYMFILVASYSVTINLIEGLWLSKAKEFYINEDELIHYQGQVLFWTGVFTLTATASSSFILKYCKWRFAANLTPIISIIMGGGFFLLISFESSIKEYFTLDNSIVPLFLIITLGALQNIFIKGVKYSYFDVTKEMLFIPLNRELRTKGKAAVEVMGARGGKLISVFFQFLLFTLFSYGSYSDIVIPLMLFFLISCFLWIIVVKKLDLIVQPDRRELRRGCVEEEA